MRSGLNVLRYFRFLPSFVVVLSLVLSPLASSAASDFDFNATTLDSEDGGLPQSDLDARSTPIDEDVASDFNDIDKEAQARTEQTKQWTEAQEAVLPRLLEAAVKLEERAKQIEKESGAEKVENMIAASQFMVDLDGAGTAEYRLIDGQRVPRVLYGDDVYILIDEKLISRNSPHLQQYIARTHIESGMGRPVVDKNGKPVRNIFGFQKKQGGRNLFIAFFNDDVNNAEVVALPKPHFTHWQWWRDFYRAKKKMPSWNDFTLAFTTGFLLQGIMQYGLTMIKSHHLGMQDWHPAVFTGFFGLYIGSIISFYKNMTNNNKSLSPLTRTLKRQFLSSMPFAYGLIMAFAPDLHHGLAAISLLSAAGLSKNLSIWSNGIMNNYAGSFWNSRIGLRERIRADSGRFQKFGFEYTVGDIKKTWYLIDWSKSNLYYNLYSMVPWVLNQLGLIAIASVGGSLTAIPGTEINLPVVQFAGIPIAMYWTKIYARRLANQAKEDPDLGVHARELEDLATKYETAWSNLWDFKTMPQRVIAGVRRFNDALNTVSATIYLRCQEILNR